MDAPVPFVYAERLEPRVRNFVCFWLCRRIHPARIPIRNGCPCAVCLCGAAGTAHAEFCFSGFAGEFNRHGFRSRMEVPVPIRVFRFPRDPRCDSAFAERLEPHQRDIFFSEFADEFNRHGFPCRTDAPAQCQSAFAVRLDAPVPIAGVSFTTGWVMKFALRDGLEPQVRSHAWSGRLTGNVAFRSQNVAYQSQNVAFRSRS